MSITTLNFPYYIYPGYPFSGYFDTKTYNENLLLLNEQIRNLTTEILSSQKSCLLHLTIGACMEEYLTLENNKDLLFQWQQLLPIHLRESAKNGTKVINLIVSPTKTFSISEWNVPLFVQQTNEEFDWSINISEIIIIKSKKYDITNYIFCTMMPAIDKRNDSLFKKYDETQKNKFYANLIKQTDADKNYIINFYNNLKFLIDTIVNCNGITTCFSFAVFNDETSKARYNNFSMFTEILNCFDNNNFPNMLIGEWVFIESCYIINLYNTNEHISYIDINDKYIKKLIIFSYDDKLNISVSK